MRGPWAYENPSCASVGSDFWFPDRDAGDSPVRAINAQSEEVKLAISVCNGCAHKFECRQWGIEHERHGIWGGLTEGSRRPFRKLLNITVKEVGFVNLAESLGNSTHQSDTVT
jgi:hypothetical protein